MEAVAYKDGNTVSKSVLESAAGKTRIALRPEKTRLLSDGQDLCYLNIDLTGENQVTRSSADQKLTVKIERAGYLLAFGSARPHMKENFYSDTHTTFYGKALAVIRAGYGPGDIKISVSGEGLETQSVVISVRE